MASTGASDSKRSTGGDRSRSRDRKPRARKAADQREPLPLVGGRYFWGALLLAVMVLPAQCMGDCVRPLQTPPAKLSRWEVGKSYDVTVTLITADYDRLSCVLEEEVNGKRCAHKTDKEEWPRKDGAPLDDNKLNELQPYKTWPGDKLILISGLWAQPDLAMRYHEEPPRGRPHSKLARFTARCRVKTLKKLPRARVAWSGRAFQWNDNTKEPVWVTEAEHCYIEQTP